MELKGKIEITVKNNNNKPECCSLECPYNNLIGDRIHPNGSYCELYHKSLNCYLDYNNFRWIWVNRCSECLKNFNEINKGENE